jgi:predicted ArsR family transcriptional regulator
MPSLGNAIRRIPAARMMAIAELLVLARQHLTKLEPHERRRVVELVRRGRGRPSHLSERDRRELARLVEKAEPREFARSAVKKVVGVPLPGARHQRSGNAG